jgi:hypothetical protein
LFSVSITFLTPLNGHSTLIEVSDPSGHVTYDDQTGYYWIWDLNYFSSQTYDQQLDTIDGLNTIGNEYFGLSGWHMANFEEMESLWAYEASELVTVFNPTYIDPTSISYAGRFDEIFPYYIPSHYFGNVHIVHGTPEKWGLYNYGIYDHDISDRYGAWVLTAGPVPEPATFILFSSGIAGLLALRIRRKSKN